MLDEDKLISPEKFYVKPGSKINLRYFDTGYKGKEIDKNEAGEILDTSRKRLAEIQDMLYAHDRYSILIIFQAMDAAGKDGAVKHVMSGFNPLGVKVYSFKAPNAQEIDHDYFWRHYNALPARGEIAIHNRSHYENVLVTKVHPEYILSERIPGIDTIEKINDKFWELRYQQINRMESNLYENGTIILKFFLHVSKKEQKKRFLERIDDPSKNWKFSLADLKERGYWSQYQQAYAEALSATSHEHAPWFVVPADNKWFARLTIASVIYKQFQKLDMTYPTLNQAQKTTPQKARELLQSEEKE
jgi:PPK2 family polyphosphate:nucleotide phosphotransferase